MATLMTQGPVDVPIGYQHHGVANPTWLIGTVGAQREVAELHRPKVRIADLRKDEFTPTLDANGFEFRKGLKAVPRELKEKEEEVKPQVYEDIINSMKEATGASYVFLFSHIMRTDPWSKALEVPKDTDPRKKSEVSTTAQFCHVDQSYAGAKSLLDTMIERSPPEISSEMSSRANKRWAIINAWRPVATINREPLACTDGRSVPDTDLTPLTFDLSVQRPDARKTAEAWQGYHSDKHKWYYASNMTPEEGLLIKCFDTKMDGNTCRRALHSAFQHPEDFGPGRQSCEFRCLVFWDSEDQSEVERQHAFDNDYYRK